MPCFIKLKCGHLRHDMTWPLGVQWHFEFECIASQNVVTTVRPFWLCCYFTVKLLLPQYLNFCYQISLIVFYELWSWGVLWHFPYFIMFVTYCNFSEYLFYSLRLPGMLVICYLFLKCCSYFKFFCGLQFYNEKHNEVWI